MEVILRDHVENVGRRGEVVKVADGYARNFLLPRKLALVATPGNLKQVAKERVKFDALEAVERTAAEQLASQLNGIQVVISRKVGETGALYGSVTSADVAEALAKQGFEIDKRKIGLREPIKQLGEKTVPVKLHPTVTVQLPIRVTAEGNPKSRSRALKRRSPGRSQRSREHRES
jgi:large subunit ribosomal protein L9